jgi:hypothetical protein
MLLGLPRTAQSPQPTGQEPYLSLRDKKPRITPRRQVLNYLPDIHAMGTSRLHRRHSRGGRQVLAYKVEADGLSGNASDICAFDQIASDYANGNEILAEYWHRRLGVTRHMVSHIQEHFEIASLSLYRHGASRTMTTRLRSNSIAYRRELHHRVQRWYFRGRA